MKRLNLLFFIPLFLLSCSQQKPKEKKEESNPDYKTAVRYRDQSESDSAFRYFNKAKDIFSQQKDSLEVAKCLINMAIIATDAGDNFGGQELSLNASSYLNPENKEHLTLIGSNLNSIGISYFNLKNYPKAIEYYKQALKYVDEEASLGIKNNIGNAYRRLGQYQQSLASYQNILNRGIQGIEYAKVLSNFSFTKWLQDPNYNAAPNLLIALSIRKKENSLWGQNSSYAHLADFYAKKRPDSALLYAKEMYHVAKDLKSEDDQLEALQKLVTLSPEQSTKKYFERYQKLDDSLQTARNRAKNQFALIRYDAEKHKAESLKFQKDSSEKTYQLIFLASGSILLIGGIIFWYRKRKQRLQMEAENTIKENKLKTYKRVHDVLANGVYQLMTKVEHQKEIDKEHLLDEMEDLYEKTRNISYEKPVATNIDFHQKIAGLLNSFDSDRTLITVIGNTEDLWKQVTLESKDEVWHILQELMVNMDKHSRASEVTLSFELKQQEVHVFYKDNGIGIKGPIKAGNGLQNVETRIHSINGQLTFEPELEKGLQVHFSFPV